MSASEQPCLVPVTTPPAENSMLGPFAIRSTEKLAHRLVQPLPPTCHGFLRSRFLWDDLANQHTHAVVLRPAQHLMRVCFRLVRSVCRYSWLGGGFKAIPGKKAGIEPSGTAIVALRQFLLIWRDDRAKSRLTESPHSLSEAAPYGQKQKKPPAVKQGAGPYY
jgi:hypothetical protein